MKLTMIPLLLAISLSMNGCATKRSSFVGNPEVAPGAQGVVKTKLLGDDNMQIDLSVKHLAPSNRLAEAAANYVVWVQPQGQSTPTNIGTLSLNSDQEGHYRTTVPYHTFRLFVTPENSRTPNGPSGDLVFEQQITRE